MERGVFPSNEAFFNEVDRVGNQRGSNEAQRGINEVVKTNWTRLLKRGPILTESPTPIFRIVNADMACKVNFLHYSTVCNNDFIEQY